MSEDAGSRAARAVAPRGGFRAAGRSPTATSLTSLAGGQAGQGCNRLTGQQGLMHSLRASRVVRASQPGHETGTSAPGDQVLVRAAVQEDQLVAGPQVGHERAVIRLGGVWPPPRHCAGEGPSP